VAIIYTALLIPVLCFSEERETEHLFRIERSKNVNIVQYDAQLTQKGKLDPEKPVMAYSIMYTNSGEKEELNWIEKKMTYGFKVKYDAEGELWVMDLVADIQRKIKVCKVTGRRLAVEKMNCLPGQRVLEVGVGIALSLSFYPGQSSVVGIDISPHMLARANQRVLSKGLRNCALGLMDAQNMGFAHGSFDKVSAMYVL